MAVPPLLFAAHGDRARSWAEVVRRSRELALFAAIDLSAGGIEGLHEALDARPDAAVAVWAKGPLEATRFAERLALHPGPSLLHPAPAHPPLGSGVQVTHGWLTLSGVAAIARLFASSSSRPESVRLRVRGLPEGPGAGLVPALYQALTIVRRFGLDAAVTRALLEDEQHLALVLDVDGVPWRVEVGARKGPAMQLAARTSGGDYVWSADAVSESLERSNAEPRAMPAVPWAERCLHQLASPIEGADLADARAARALVDAVELALERRLPPTPFAHERSAPPPVPEVTGSFRIPSARELDAIAADALARIGLEGDMPDAPGLVPCPPPEPALPLEALAYRFELRPAVVLEALPHEADRIAALLPGTIVRRERCVLTPPSVPHGEPTESRVIDLFAAREPSIAERLAELAGGDPIEVASSIGGLLGYPACCVQAFVAQGEAWDESESRYAIAARTSFGPGPWPALLDDTSLALSSHRPCTYRCERSREHAAALLAALATEDAALRDAILRSLGGPVLYFDRDHQIRFRGTVSEGGIAYHGVSIPRRGSAAFARLAGVMARGDRLALGAGALTVLAGEERILTMERTDPGLGIILPFGTTAEP